MIGNDYFVKTQRRKGLPAKLDYVFTRFLNVDTGLFDLSTSTLEIASMPSGVVSADKNADCGYDNATDANTGADGVNRKRH